MKENNLVASVALFSELYNTKNYSSITDIIGEFIKCAVVTENRWTISPTELTDLVNEVYHFKIPNAVIKTTIKTKLKNVTKNDNFGQIVFDKKISEGYEKFNEEYESIRKQQLEIESNLFDYVNIYKSGQITDSEKEEIIDNFNKYLLDSGVSEKYSNLISGFIIKNKNNQSFVLL